MKTVKTPYNFKDMMKFRSMNTQGIKTEETKAATRQYMNLRNNGLFQKFKEDYLSGEGR